MNSLIKICLIFVSVCAVFSETFTGNAAADIPTQQAMSYQYSNLILEFQSLTAWMRTISGWRMMYSDVQANGVSYLEIDDDDSDFVLEENNTQKPSLEMWGQMGMGTGGYGAVTPQFQNKDISTKRRIEADTEYSMMTYLKYLNLITARKLEAAQNTHYQSRAVTSALQGLGATNPMATSLLYMLYYRDVLQTMMTSQAIQRHDIWTVWNFLEIMETNEDPDKTQAPAELKSAIKKAYATSMRVFATEAMLDFQTFMIDYYLQPMLAQLAGPAAAPAPAPAPASFLEEEVEAQPEKPFFGQMNSPQYMMYYLSMMKFYVKYILLNAAQTLATEAGYAVAPNVDSKVVSHLPVMKQYGLASLQQWVQLKFYLLYFDMFMMGGMGPRQIFEGPAAAHLAATNLVQTEDVAQSEPRLQNPVIENQVPAAVEQPQQAVPQQLPQQVQPRQSVVG